MRNTLPTGTSARELRHAAVLSHLQFKPGVDPLLEFGHVRDDPDHASGLLQVFGRAGRKIQGFGVEGAETLVDKDRVEPDAARVGLHHVRQAPAPWPFRWAWPLGELKTLPMWCCPKREGFQHLAIPPSTKNGLTWRFLKT